jgi:hypothetical protein
MKLTEAEIQFLTALSREQNQSGCRGPAHDLLRQHVYPQLPRSGPGSLSFSYEAVPLTSLLVKDLDNLQSIDDFLRHGDMASNVVWPWLSPTEYRARLEEARLEWKSTPGSAQSAGFNVADPTSGAIPGFSATEA